MAHRQAYHRNIAKSVCNVEAQFWNVELQSALNDCYANKLQFTE